MPENLNQEKQMKSTFKLAEINDVPKIWEILKQAIARRKADNSNQWQDGYPNPEVIKSDIEKKAGFVVLFDHEIAGYVAVLINDEPEYDNIVGKWLTNGDFVVFHRVAISDRHLGMGLAKEICQHIESYAKASKIPSIKADTNFDNPAMLNLFEKMGYVYCGEVFFRGSPRKAYEKVV
jgi:RimJ/RimL family protein N-acetyltransferase